jgi:acylpyruvate hydrolase
MRLTTIRYQHGTRAARVEGDDLVLLDAVDVGAVLRGVTDPQSDGEVLAAADAERAPLIVRPDKIICVGANYRNHIEEMGRKVPAAPTYFAKYRRALIGSRDDIALPPTDVSTHIDWEAELAVIIGSELRFGSATESMAAIAGFTVLNDVTVRDYQRRTTQFLAGKTFEGTTPLGPDLVTTDEVGDGSGLEIQAEVDGEVKQSGNTAELVFNAVDIVADLSKVITLEPGDVIATGTPGGVGAARTPPEWMSEGTILRTSISRLGECVNTCRRP